MQGKKQEQKKNSGITAAIIVVVAILIIVLLFFLLGGCSKKYTIEFNSNGGSLVEPIKIEKDGTIEKPLDPTREGYIFAGWYLNGEKFDFNTKITGDITLEARWTKKEEGSCTITCEEGYSLNEEKCECEKIAEDKLALDRTSITLTVGGSYTLKLTIPSRFTDKTVTWKSSNPDIVTVDKNGKITAKKVGSAEVTATVEGESVTVKVTVKEKTEEKDVEVTKIGVSGDKEMNVGDSQKLKLTVKPSNATNKDVKWESSDTSIATVDKNGKVKALKEGKVTITATAKDGSKESDSITITITSVYEITFTGEHMAEGSSTDFSTRYTYKVTKDGKEIKDYLGFTVGSKKCTPGAERVSSNDIESKPEKVELKLSDGRTVSAKANYKK